MNDPVPAPLRDVLNLYAEKYPEVRFPDLDLAVLERGAEAIAAAANRLAEAEAALEPLREQMRLAELELTQRVGRALAFLKIYVDGDEEQYARLDVLTQALLSRRSVRRPAESPAASGAERTRRGRKARAAAMLTEPDPVTLSDDERAELDLPSSALSELEPAAE